MASLLINAVSAKAGGGINDLVETLPRLRRRLRERGWEVRTWVVKAGWEALERAGETEGVECVEVESAVRRGDWELRRFPRIVKSLRPPAVFQFSNLIFRSLPVPQVTVLRSPTFFSDWYRGQTRRGVYPRLRYAVGRRASRQTIERAAAVFCVSGTHRDDIIRCVGPLGEKVRVNHLGVSLPEWARNLTREDALSRLPESVRAKIAPLLDAGSNLMLNVAHHYPHKNFVTLLEAMRLLRDRVAEARLVITAGIMEYRGRTGERESRERELAADLLATGHLLDLGPVPKDWVWALLRLARVFMFPSWLESFGHPLLEAQAMGVPVVASDTPIHREIAGQGAVFHETMDPGSLAKAARCIQGDASLRERVIAAGSKNVARFTWEAHVDKLVDAILRVAQQGAA